MGRHHYGWYIAAACLFMCFGAALMSTGMAVTLNGLRSIVGFSGTETSFITTVICTSALVITFFSDRLYARIGMRWGTAFPMICGGIAFLIFTVADRNIWVYYIGAVFGGFTYGLGMMLPASILMRSWFNKNRGFAMSICSCGTGLAVAIGSPTLQYVIDNLGLCASFYVEATYMFIVAILMLAVVRNDPSDMGLEPVGGKDYVPPAAAGGRCNRDSAIWLIVVLTIATALCGFCASPATSNFALNFNTEGIDSMMVALALSVYGVFLLFSKLILGRIMDRYGALFTTLLFGIVVTAGLFGCYFIRFFPEVSLMFMCMFLLGFGYSLMTLGYPNWAADFSSAGKYPVTLKRFHMGYQLGSLLGSPVPGMIADITESYTLAYLSFAIIMIVMMLSVIICYRCLRNSESTSSA